MSAPSSNRACFLKNGTRNRSPVSSEKGDGEGMTGSRCWLAFVWAAGALGGCSTLGHVRGAPLEAGILRSYPSPFESVRKAAAGALTEVALGPLEEGWIDRGRWSVLGSTPRFALATRVARV